MHDDRNDASHGSIERAVAAIHSAYDALTMNPCPEVPARSVSLVRHYVRETRSELLAAGRWNRDAAGAALVAQLDRVMSLLTLLETSRDLRLFSRLVEDLALVIDQLDGARATASSA